MDTDYSSHPGAMIHEDEDSESELEDHKKAKKAREAEKKSDAKKAKKKSKVDEKLKRKKERKAALKAKRKARKQGLPVKVDVTAPTITEVSSLHIISNINFFNIN